MERYKGCHVKPTWNKSDEALLWDPRRATPSPGEVPAAPASPRQPLSAPDAQDGTAVFQVFTPAFL